MSNKVDIWDKYKRGEEKTSQDVLTRCSVPLRSSLALPSTPILTNHDHKACKSSPNYKPDGSIYACAIIEMQDNKEELIELNNWINRLSSNGAGVSVTYDNLRPKGCKVGDFNYKVEGILPFMGLFESSLLAFKQGNRPGAGVAWMSIDNCEIRSFIKARIEVSKGGPMQNCMRGVHLGVVITDEFMECYKNGTPFQLKTPANYKRRYGSDVEHMEVLEEFVDPRELLASIVRMRFEHGEPFIMFKGNVGNDEIKCPNLCTEVLLPTNSKKRLALCCLASIDLFEIYQRDNFILVEAICALADYLLELRSFSCYKTLPYSEDNTYNIGIGFSGIVDTYNYLVGTLGLEAGEEKYALFMEHVYAAMRLAKTQYASKLEYMYAIAPNVNVSQLLGDASPGIMPRLAVVVDSKSQEFRTTTCRVYEKTLPENRQHLIYTSSGREAINRHYEKIVKPFIKEVDQGISYTLVCDKSSTTEEELDRLVMLHKDGLKTVYYHTTLDNTELMKVKRNRKAVSLFDSAPEPISNTCDIGCSSCQN